MSAMTSPMRSARMDPMPAPLLTTRATAELLAVSTRMVYKLIADGSLAAVRIGRATRVSVDDVFALVDARRDRRGGKPAPIPGTPSPSSAQHPKGEVQLPSTWPSLPYPALGRRPRRRGTG